LARTDLPSGTVTFLFTDVEGSTTLLHEVGAERYAEALAEHRRVIREACAAQGGVEVDTQGDAFFFAFPTAPGALAAAEAFTDALARGPIRVRVGLHTGRPLLTDEGYVGDDVHFAARVGAASHGGQVVLSSATAQLVEHELVDLGEHRLKDIAEAVPIFQLGGGSFPPLKTISNTNLPRPASSFVGREAELGEVLSRLASGARLLTLTGPGGTGKTRLALEAASTLVPEYKAGVFWVGLASLRDPALVTETIAQTLGAKDGLAEHIGERELCLLLDNLEQVVECAPELSALLQACPNLTLLVTSRELLRVQGEVEYPVPPLATPEAVSLFCARSQLEPSEEIAELCARLDSLPLAVELAAARASALTVSQILERLSSRLDLLKGGRDADPRQRTLRATIEWSYDLLSGDEQQLFARLSVFAGGCTLEAAEEVCGADVDTLQSLVEKSLLRFTDERYWMLETIREFAGERLDEVSRASLIRGLAEHLAAVAVREGAPHFVGRQSHVYERLEVEHPNVREVAAYAISTQTPGPVLRLSGVLWLHWCSRHVVEAEAWVAWATAARPDVDDDVWLPALLGAGEVIRFAGDLDHAAEMKERFLVDVAGYEAADPLWEAGALVDLADIALHRGDLDEALDYGERSLAIREARGLGTDRALVTLGDIAMRRGDLEHAERLLSEAATGFERQGHEINYASALGTLAEVERRRGDSQRAETLVREALGRLAALGDRPLVAECLRLLAILAADRGLAERAGTLWGAAEAIFASDGLRGELAFDEEKLDVPDDARATGWKLSYDQAVEYALASID
jgi:predicted ATPase